MPGVIPNATFRIDQSFSVKPDLIVDQGPDNGVVVGAYSGGSYEALYIGKQAEPPFRNVWMDTRGAHAVYVMGKRRSGKSYTLGALAEGLAANGWIRQGTSRQGILILDTMNVYLTMACGVESTYDATSGAVQEMRKWKLDSEEVSTSLFRPRGTEVPDVICSEEVSLRASDLGADEWCGLFEVDAFGDPLGHLITELCGRVSQDGYIDSRSGAPVRPNAGFTLNDLIAALLFDGDLQRYHRDTRESLRRRLESIRRLPVFSDAGLDVRQLVRPGHISVLLLRELDHQLRGVIVALIVKKLMQLRGTSEQYERVSAIHAARAKKLLADGDPDGASREELAAAEAQRDAQAGLPRCWLIIDEAHNYVPAQGVVASRRPLKKYIDEGRNLGLSIVVATQQPSGLDPSIRRNADLVVIHSLSHRDDIIAAEGMVNTALPSEVTLGSRQRFEGPRSFETLVRNLPLGYAVLSSDRASRLFPVRVRPRVTVHGGGEY
jgi:hypothetical protein